MIAILKFDLPGDAELLQHAKESLRYRSLIDEFTEFLKSSQAPVSQERDEIEITWLELMKKHKVSRV